VQSHVTQEVHEKRAPCLDLSRTQCGGFPASCPWKIDHENWCLVQMERKNAASLGEVIDLGVFCNLSLYSRGKN